jgi:hypothetical protein
VPESERNQEVSKHGERKDFIGTFNDCGALFRSTIWGTGEWALEAV